MGLLLNMYYIFIKTEFLRYTVLIWISPRWFRNKVEWLFEAMSNKFKFIYLVLTCVLKRKILVNSKWYADKVV